MVGHITYLSDDILGEKFGRSLKNSDSNDEKKRNIEFQISSYLNYQGDKFTKTFDANSYILITKMLDMFNFEGNSPQNNQVFKTSKCKFLVISFSSDWRFSPECSEKIVQHLIDEKKNVTYLRIQSNKGHDSFLLPNERYENGLSLFLTQTLAENTDFLA
jgi:homoserine O-acetyltransferase